MGHLNWTPLLRNMLRTLVFSGLLVSCLAAGQFSYQDCTRNDTNRLGRLENINLAVHPVRFPGNETGSIDIVILRPIAGNNLQLSVHIQKKVFMGFVDVPCLTTVDPPVRSCDYDLCGILAGLPYASDPHHCPKQIADTSPDFQCACPFQPGTYSLNPTTVFITEPRLRLSTKPTVMKRWAVTYFMFLLRQTVME